jgi:hypothetical protein
MMRLLTLRVRNAVVPRSDKNKKAPVHMGRERGLAVPPKLAKKAHFAPTSIGFPDNGGSTV